VISIGETPSMTERIANTIVVRSRGPLPPPGLPKGETRNDLNLEELRKYASSKPLFRPKTLRERQQERQKKDDSKPE
jgi:hypothetical protein